MFDIFLVSAKILLSIKVDNTQKMVFCTPFINMDTC